jgi:hypothetical protein
MINYRKIGGIHWLAIGRWRVSFCRKRATPAINQAPILVARQPTLVDEQLRLFDNDVRGVAAR